MERREPPAFTIHMIAHYYLMLEFPLQVQHQSEDKKVEAVEKKSSVHDKTKVSQVSHHQVYRQRNYGICRSQPRLKRLENNRKATLR